MKKIIGVIRPFDLQQTLYVFEDGEQIDAVSTTIENLNHTIFGLSDKYEVDCVDLSGAKKFNAQLAEKLAEEEMLRYNKSMLDINVI